MEGEPLKILRLGESCNDGMVKTLHVIVDEAEGAFAIDRRALDTFEKKLPRCVMGTTESSKNPTRVEHAEGTEMDFLVTPHGIFHRLLISSERRRIQNNKIVGFLVFAEKIKGVGGDCLDLDSR